jgi:IS1 family transposase/transposase-like protein
MPHHLYAWLVLVLLLLLGLADLRRLFPLSEPERPVAKETPPKTSRPLRPRSPDDCPACRPAAQQSGPTVAAPVQPWRQRKSRRGRHKRISTDGYACPNPDCKYHNITEANGHALVGYGHHGKREPIQDLYCQACRRKFSVRHHTALSRLKTSAARVALVLTALAEGLSVSGAVRTFGHRERTITTWLLSAGTHAEHLDGRLFRNLQLLEVQLDELRTTLRDKGQEVWIGIACDAKTKVIASVPLGPRTQVLAHALIHALVQVLTPGCVPLCTSDGLDLYFYALTAHFGQWVQVAGEKKRQWQVAAELLYGQVKKRYRRRKLARVERRMRWGTWEAFQAKVLAPGVSRTLNTAFVERINLTLRRGIAALQRRSWSTTQTQRHLELHFEWWRAYYHFVRPHGSLRERLDEPQARCGKQRPQAYRQRTPAMAVGVTGHRWTVVEVLSFPLPA